MVVFGAETDSLVLKLEQQQVLRKSVVGRKVGDAEPSEAIQNAKFEEVASDKSEPSGEDGPYW